MDKEEILKLEEGKEMDELVAEMVMGWHKGNYIYPDGVIIGEENSDWLDAEGRYMYGVGREDDNIDEESFHLLHWHPSGSMLWAWEVVEKMEEKGLQFIMENVIPNSDEIVYSAMFGDHKFFNWEFTMPLAICRAALLTTIEE